MTKFFLNLRDGKDFIEDFEGGSFPDLDAAHAEAVEAAREILCERLKAGEILNGQRIEICDENGAVLDTVEFRSVFTVSGQPAVIGGNGSRIIGDNAATSVFSVDALEDEMSNTPHITPLTPDIEKIHHSEDDDVTVVNDGSGGMRDDPADDDMDFEETPQDESRRSGNHDQPHSAEK